MKLVLCFVFVNVTRRVQTAGGALMMMMMHLTIRTDSGVKKKGEPTASLNT